MSAAKRAWQTRKKKGFYKHKRRKGELSSPVEKPQGKGQWKRDETFFTDDQKRVRRIPQKLKQPRSATQAIEMIAKREIRVTGSLELQNEFDAVNKQHFKGKLKDATIMKAYLPKVKHKAFVAPNTSIVIINTAKTSTLEEQKLALRHEIVHLAGFHGHGFLFELTAERIGAPVAEYEGKFITREEHDEIKIKRAVERERLKREAREKKMGMKKGEGTLIREGKPVARVIFYEGKQGIKTAKRVSSISDHPKRKPSEIHIDEVNRRE